MGPIVVIDNYDSFTYNLVDLIKRHTSPLVFRNDEITSEELAALRPSGVLISPGPGRPEDSQVSLDFTLAHYPQIPILGICLGHQLLGHIFGVKVGYASQPMHGKCSPIYHDSTGIFHQLPSPLEVMRYHSLILTPQEKWPDALSITAKTKAGEIMAIAHQVHPLIGLQFHPESILTQGGEQMIYNWLKIINRRALAN